MQREIRTQSARIRWLLQRLLCEELDPDKPNHGLSQGGAGSGFYANAYLTEFDSKFGINNQWEAQLFRFVDDIVIVIPDLAYLNDVKNAAIATLKDLGLQVNEEKSEPFDQNKYLNLPRDKGVMNELSEKFDDLTKPLWRTNRVIREQLRREGSWWPTIGVYRDHLHAIGHYIEPHRLSRKLYQYVEKYTLEQEEEGKDQDNFKLPSLGNPTWAEEFTTANDKWIKNRECLRAELIELAKDSYRELSEVTCDKQKRILSTRIYFSANRLARLGYGDSVELLTNILICQPWIIRQPQYVIRGLAIQGFSSHIENLFNHYKALDNSWSSSFLAVIVRAIRHLSEVPESLEDGIIRLAIDDGFDHIVRLLATETWLMKLDCTHVAEHRSRIQKLIELEQNSRVRKNYLLLLAKCANESVLERDYEDPLMTHAMEVAMTGSIEELFDYVEPGLLRERYYSTYFPSHMDFDDESPFSG